MWKYFVITGTGILFLLSLWILIRPEAPSSGIFVRLSYDNLENWSRDHQSLAFRAYKKSCPVLLAQSTSGKKFHSLLDGLARDWAPSCDIALKSDNLTDIQARRFFEQNFSLLSYNKGTEGLFTGYFTPEYLGSDRRNGQYNYPLYGLPEDLKILDLGKFDSSLRGKTVTGEVRDGEFIPYKARKNIDKGALDNKQLELVWLKDRVDVFFMQIQGSGVIVYENGDRKMFGYGGKNGRAYHSIGKFLIEGGKINRQDMSMQAIRAWLEANPEKAEKLMWKNPSYVFFRPLEGDVPPGTMNVILTAGRSVAVDPQYVPLGMPLWLDLKSSTDQAGPIRRLVIAQDTGGAIKGRMRADIYWGVGGDAARMAGPMKDRGRYYFLAPNTLAARILSRKGNLQ